MPAGYKVYEIFDKETEEVLYIGKTIGGLGTRLCGHRSQARSSKPSRLSLYLQEHGEDSVGIRCIKDCDTPEEMESLEKQLIKERQPPYNYNFVTKVKSTPWVKDGVGYRVLLPE